MTEPRARWMLYRHRQDPSVAYLARPLDNGAYEIKAMGGEASWTMPTEDFLAIYERSGR